MIYLYSGSPGSGKSCHQAEDIMKWLKFGNSVVIANYDVDVEKIKMHHDATFLHVENWDLSPEFLKSWSNNYFKTHVFYEGCIRLYIDEAQLLFNAREWNVKDRKHWTEFFTQHRKYGYDIFLVAQFDQMLDRQMRSLIEYELMHRKLNNAGWKYKLLGFFLGGNTYLAVKYWYPVRMLISTEIHHIRKKYYTVYDSYKDFNGNAITHDVKKKNMLQVLRELLMLPIQKPVQLIRRFKIVKKGKRIKKSQGEATTNEQERPRDFERTEELQVIPEAWLSGADER